MSFTVLRVEVQQWKNEGIFLPVCGQSEEGVETDNVVEEAGHQEDCGHLVMTTVVEFEHKNDIGEYICCRKDNV